MLEGCAALGRNGWFPGVIGPRKECIESLETCFAEGTLSFLMGVQAWSKFVSQSFVALWLSDRGSEWALVVL